MRAFVVSIAACFVTVTAAAPIAALAAPPGENCGTITGPRWTAPGHRSGRRWDVAESGTTCPTAEFVVRELLREHPDRHGRLRPTNAAFTSCSVDVRHRNIHPYATGECVGDRVGLSWGIHH